MYAGVFTLLIAVIAIGYRMPQEDIIASSTAQVADVTQNNATKLAVNDVVSTNIAASVAHTASLAVAPNVSERAVTMQTLSDYGVSADTSIISKPAIVQLSAATRNVTQYVAVEGDTATSIAAKHNISVETVRWANNLTGDAVTVGSTLEILPRDGILYTVKDGDTVEKIAEKYKVDVSLVTTYNDLEIDGLSAGLKVILPGGTLPTEERPGYVAPRASGYSSSYASYSGFISGVGAWSGQVLSTRSFRGVDSNNGGYAAGNCTAWAYYRRAQLGKPVPRMLGNAISWATNARNVHGMSVSKTPSVGAVIQAGNHVGIVEGILPNGDLQVSDMNYGYRLWNLADRIVPASTIHNYYFIH